MYWTKENNPNVTFQKPLRSLVPLFCFYHYNMGEAIHLFRVSAGEIIMRQQQQQHSSTATGLTDISDLYSLNTLLHRASNDCME